MGLPGPLRGSNKILSRRMADIALRIDVDTYDGLRVGVPRILELLRELDVRGSFFVTFGPERAGLRLKRIWDPVFIWKMVRTRALRTYGWRTLLGGTLLPVRSVGESFGPLLCEMIAEGHEIGLHGYDHFGWQSRIHQMTRGEVEAAFRMGISAFTATVGYPPQATAAPGWRTTAEALDVQGQFGFKYASDARGSCPFLARADGISFATLQIPTTMPTMDELKGRVRDLSATLHSAVRPGLNVFTAHAETEGGPLLSDFRRFLCQLQSRRVEIRRLADVAEEFLADIGRVPFAEVGHGLMRGRSGWVLMQQGGMYLVD